LEHTDHHRLKHSTYFEEYNESFGIVQDWYGTVQPSRLAGGCLAAAGRLLGKPWTPELADLTGCLSIEKLADITRYFFSFVAVVESGIRDPGWI
jgi:hypothetical protein